MTAPTLTPHQTRVVASLIASRDQLTGFARDEFDAFYRCALYRHYDAADTLLYVGVSRDPEKRWQQHKSRSPWAQFGFVARVSVEWLSFEVQARAAEISAIQAENPVFNVLRRKRGVRDRLNEVYLGTWREFGHPVPCSDSTAREIAQAFVEKIARRGR